jgi:CBS domain-containing protein
MLCREIMKTEVECVRKDESVQDAARKMRDRNVGFVPICDESGRVEGTLTDRDIAIRLVAAGLPASTSAQEVMTRDVVACSPEDDVKRALELMSKFKKSRILCTNDGGELVGVISLSDLAQRLGKDATGALRDVSQREARA